MTTKYKIAVKIGVQVTLFVVFLNMFGIPSLNRFNAKKVLMTSVEEKQGHFSVPAVTICPMNATSQYGFRKVSSQTSAANGNMVWDICKGLKHESIVQCIEENTYDQQSTIVKVTKEYLSDDHLPHYKWIPDFSLAFAGMCYTLETNYTLGTDLQNSNFKIELDHQKSSVAFVVHIHDPNFLVVNLNPVLPFNMFKLAQDKPKFKHLRFIVIQHKNLDVPSKRCNPDPSYSFTSCIKEVFSAQVGCRLYWDSWTDRDIPVCHSLLQYRLVSNRLEWIYESNI